VESSEGERGLESRAGERGSWRAGRVREAHADVLAERINLGSLNV